MEDVERRAAQFSTALEKAQTLDWCTPEEARRLWWRFAGDPEAAEASPGVSATPAAGSAG